MKVQGSKNWVIPDARACYLKTARISAESIVILNMNEDAANIEMTAYYEDKEPLTNFTVKCEAKRMLKLSTEKIRNFRGKELARDIPYSLHIESDVPVVVSYSRISEDIYNMAIMPALSVE